jgi:hypothetical protein
VNARSAVVAAAVVALGAVPASRLVWALTRRAPSPRGEERAARLEAFRGALGARAGFWTTPRESALEDMGAFQRAQYVLAPTLLCPVLPPPLVRDMSRPAAMLDPRPLGDLDRVLADGPLDPARERMLAAEGFVLVRSAGEVRLYARGAR